MNNETPTEITKVLTTTNPHINTNTVIYNSKDMEFVHVSPAHTVILYSVRGCLASKSMENQILQIDKYKQQIVPHQKAGPKSRESTENSEESHEDEKEDALPLPSRKKSLLTDDRKLINQFNFSDRASLSHQKVCRDKNIQTEQTCLVNFSENITQWGIFDSYQEDYEQQERKREKKASQASKIPETDSGNLHLQVQGEDHIAPISGLKTFETISKIIERMISHNIHGDITLDFKFWDDPMDEYRVPEGSVLPLWKFSLATHHTIGKTVTTLSWNKRYKDLFAAAYGSHDFTSSEKGIICLFTLKCPSSVERLYVTNSGVLCIDFYQEKANLLAVGMQDGAVAVFNLNKKSMDADYYHSGGLEGHTGSVWQVQWLKVDPDGNKNFTSVSVDGKIILWTLVKRQMFPMRLLLLKTINYWTSGIPSIRIKTRNCGSALAFNKRDPSLYIIGTEEGIVYKCSTLCCSRTMVEFRRHLAGVYKLEWNPFHPRVFISCSADWTICIWDHTIAKPLFEFDLKQEVTDVAWAPYSSTVFAAVTRSGKLHMYDISVNRYKPICHQRILPKKAQATCLAFNHYYPLIVVGDNRGQVTSIKLSPNLRKTMINEMDVHVSQSSNEMKRLDKYLEVARALISET